MTNTPYDDVFRTLVNDCRSLLIPYVNEMFGESYSGDEEIRFYPNEHLIHQQGGEEKKRITDTCFAICGRTKKRYHLECQSGEDHTMLIRMFEYDTQIALDERTLESHILTVTFPQSGILYLRGKEIQPDKMIIKLHTPGGDLSSAIPVMKLNLYTIDEIFEKKLYLLIPFYIFVYEKYFPIYDSDKKALVSLREKFERIRDKLETLCQQG